MNAPGRDTGRLVPMRTKRNSDLASRGAVALGGRDGEQSCDVEAGNEARLGPHLLAAAVPVVMGMSAVDAERLSARLLAGRGSRSAVGLRELLWLRAVFVEQRRRTAAVERLLFERRADRILAAVWRSHCPLCPSGTTNTLRRSDKR